jgi:hypothetical protein
MVNENSTPLQEGDRVMLPDWFLADLEWESALYINKKYGLVRIVNGRNEGNKVPFLLSELRIDR